MYLILRFLRGKCLKMWKSSGKWKDLAAKAVQSKDKTQESSKSRTRVQRNISIQNLQVRQQATWTKTVASLGKDPRTAWLTKI